jgi:hypothetical protein
VSAAAEEEEEASFGFWVGAMATGRDVRRKRGRVGSCEDGSEARRGEVEEEEGEAWTGPKQTIGCASALDLGGFLPFQIFREYKGVCNSGMSASSFLCSKKKLLLF